MVERGLIHGNDGEVIRLLGEHIGHQAASEIRKINYERWET